MRDSLLLHVYQEQQTGASRKSNVSSRREPQTAQEESQPAKHKPCSPPYQQRVPSGWVVQTLVHLQSTKNNRDEGSRLAPPQQHSSTCWCRVREERIKFVVVIRHPSHALLSHHQYSGGGSETKIMGKDRTPHATFARRRACKGGTPRRPRLCPTSAVPTGKDDEFALFQRPPSHKPCHS